MDMHSVDSIRTGLPRATEAQAPRQADVRPPTVHEPESETQAEQSDTAGRSDAKDLDRVEISDVSKMLAALSEQRDQGGDLQLPAEKLRRMIEG